MVSYNDKITLINYFRSVAERELCSIVRSTQFSLGYTSKIIYKCSRERTVFNRPLNTRLQKTSVKNQYCY